MTRIDLQLVTPADHDGRNWRVDLLGIVEGDRSDVIADVVDPCPHDALERARQVRQWYEFLETVNVEKGEVIS